MNKSYILDFAKKVLAIDSPSGYTKKVIEMLEKEAHELGYETFKNAKGNLHIIVEGKSNERTIGVSAHTDTLGLMVRSISSDGTLKFTTLGGPQGNLHIIVEGKSNERTIGVSAHTDTLGLMVRSISSDGTLKFTTLGGPQLPTLDGEYCRIYTRNGHCYTGTILSTSPASHVYSDADKARNCENMMIRLDEVVKSKEDVEKNGHCYTGTILSTSPASHVYSDADKARNCENMMIRLDEVVKSKEDVEKLGIQNGDIIAIDPKTTITPTDFIKSRFLDDKISVACLFGVLHHFKENEGIQNGDIIAIDPKTTITPTDFIKSRFLDDKISVACLFGVLHHFKENEIKPAYKTILIISTYEEVGHGAANIPEVDELLACDMGCIGLDLACSEYDVSICAKDSSGPYDYEMVSKLIELAKQEKCNYAVDIYPYYGSDVSAALRGGNNIRGALIGPGVHASHGMERTHYQAVESAVKLMIAYLCQ